MDEIIVRMPTPDEASRLGIEPGTPVAEHTGFTANDRPVRLMIFVIPGDTIVLRYVVPT